MELQSDTEEELILESDAPSERQSETDEEPLILDGDASSESCMDLEECDDSDRYDGGFTPAQRTFQWAVPVLTSLERIVGTRNLQLRFRRPMTYCSHFSGLGTADVAMDFIKAPSLCTRELSGHLDIWNMIFIS